MGSRLSSKFSELTNFAIASTVFTILVLQFPTVVVGRTTSSAVAGNVVALEWTDLHDWLICNTARLVAGPQVELVGVNAGHIHTAQFHLAQWHALVALESAGSCTTPEAVVAYASHRVASYYFPWAIDKFVDPLLNRQITTLALSETQELLAQRIGEAVADDVIRKRTTAKAFSIRGVKAVLDATIASPTPGIYRYFNGSAAGRDAANFVLHNSALSQTFLLGDPVAFIDDQILGHIRPPKVPSKEFDSDWSQLKDIGRIDWSGRTLQMNLLADLYGCVRVNSSTCSPDGKMHSVMKAILAKFPVHASLSETVTLLAKMSVAVYDANLVLDTLQYGFWFWRPIMAFRAGDAHHKPIPSWTPYATTPPHPEFPSGTVTSVAAAVRIMELHFGDHVGAFSVPGVGVNQPGCGTAGLPEPTLNYTSLAGVVRNAQLARMYAGAHWNNSVEAAGVVGKNVGNWIHSHWAQRTPTGVLPEVKYLKIFTKLPKKAGDFSPIQFETIKLE